MGMNNITGRALIRARSARWVPALVYGAALMLSMVVATPASSEESQPESFTRIEWTSRCESEDSEQYFFVDLLPDGVLRYEGVTDVKTLDVREERLDRRTEGRLRSALRDFLAGKAHTGKDVGGPTFCVRVRVYKERKVVDSQFALIFANQVPKTLQRINEFASPGKWACPARLSSTNSGAKSARFCDQPAFTMAVVGRSVCDPSRHVEVYTDGSVYIATRAPRGDRSLEHTFYEIGPTAVEKLVEMINAFEVSAEPGLLNETPLYRRKRLEDVEATKSRLSELTGEKWNSLEGAATCEPSGATAEVYLRRDLDREVKKEVQQR